ncbi:hypothetical protein KSS87_003706 [Heliosperma pusillum]|nr:hypothetical protein KSS87_003706 [Heliosperma pusillum]
MGICLLPFLISSKFILEVRLHTIELNLFLLINKLYSLTDGLSQSN